MENYQVVITRCYSLYGCAIKHAVEIDGLSSGILKNGSSIVINTTPGQHTISFLSYGKVVKSVSILIEPGNYTTKLFARLNTWQKLEISFDNSSTSSSNVMYFDNSTPKNHSPWKIIGIVIIILMLSGILYATFVMDASEPEPTSLQENVELTAEENAELLLEDATAEFTNDDYMSAIEICSKIMAEYPDTDVAKNIDAYLAAQYAQFDSFSATDLMNEYDSNVVNADEKYTDTVMIVSGTVNSIGKTNNDTNLVVMLNSGTYFYGVQLNFKTSQTDSVAQLAEGDTVTAIGRCTGKSGSQFFVLDGNNVMLENCYLIEQ